MSIDTTTPVLPGEVWRFEIDHRNYIRVAPAGAGVTGWASMAQDGTRQVFYGMPSRHDLFTYLLGGSGEQDVLFDHSWPPVVAVAVPAQEMKSLIPRVSGPAKPLYLSYDWTTLSTEPVNQAPRFYEWRDHLMRLAHQFITDHHYERSSLERGVLRRIPIRPSVISNSEMRRNANITHYYPEMIGHLWRLVHEWAKQTNTSWSGPGQQELAQLIGGFCDVFSGNDCIGRVHVDHDSHVWEEKLLAGYRFLPNVTSEPYGATLLSEAGAVTGFVAEHDRTNFNRALRLWRRVGKDSGVSHPWPESVTFKWYVPIPQAAPVPVQPPAAGVQEGEREREARWWAQQYLETRERTVRFVRNAYLRFVEMQILAWLRPQNVISRTAIGHLLDAKRVTADYFLDHTAVRRPMYERWLDDKAWDFGYLIFTEDDQLVRPGDGSMNNPDDARVDGEVVLIPNSEIDRTAVNPDASDDPWTREAHYVALLNQILADPSDGGQGA